MKTKNLGKLSLLLAVAIILSTFTSRSFADSILVGSGDSVLRYNSAGQYQGVYFSDATHLSSGITSITLESNQNYMDVLSGNGSITRYMTLYAGYYLNTPVTGLNNAKVIYVASGSGFNDVVQQGANQVTLYSEGAINPQTGIASFTPAGPPSPLFNGITGLQDVVYDSSYGNTFATAGGNILKNNWQGNSTLTTGNYFDLADTSGATYLYADNATDNVITKINTTTGVATPFAYLDSGDTGAGLTIDSSGNLYVASGTTGGFYEFNSSGTELMRFGQSQGVVGASDFILVNGLSPAPVVATPEPSSFTLLAIGGLVLGGYAWRKKQRTA